jgi:thiamine-phosphate pyrophosphorylase
MTLRGFYGVVNLDDGAPPRQAVALATQLLEGGACALQLRMKQGSTRAMLEAAEALLPLCRARGVPFVVNDRLDVALAVGADMLHLGQDDLPLPLARAQCRGVALKIGVSTHSPAQAEAAARAGADYLGFGPVYATATKENPDPVQGVAALAEAVRRAAAVPVVAIGGITVARAPEVAAAGAAAACVIAGVNAAVDPTAAAQAVARAFSAR